MSYRLVDHAFDWVPKTPIEDTVAKELWTYGEMLATRHPQLNVKFPFSKVLEARLHPDVLTNEERIELFRLLDRLNY